jgi:hypothetical protein
MSTSQLHSSAGLAFSLQPILTACRSAPTARQYALELVGRLAEISGAKFAAWLNWPAYENPIACTDDSELYLVRCRALADSLPILACDRSAVAAPMRFRAHISGVLAIAGGPFQQAHVQLLTELGRVALAQYEALRTAEDLSLPCPGGDFVAELVHKLRQPLDTMECCAHVIGTALPPADTHAHKLLHMLHSQINAINGVLTEAAQPFAPCSTLPEREPGELDNCVLTNAAMAAVT